MMELAINKAKETMKEGIGGPFGAVIVKNDKVLAVASNTVLGTHDPTAHAEINAIREASKVLGTHDLSDCILYATGYPCPMCLSAIIWANIKQVYYGTNLDDASEIGFRDDAIYQFLKEDDNNKDILKLECIDHEKCLELFQEYEKKGYEIY